MTEDQGLAIAVFQDRLGYHFKDNALLREALTHASFANESGNSRCNERLEHLGDAVLGLCVAETLYREAPDYDEGELTQARSKIVCESSLAAWSKLIGLPQLLRLGRSLSAKGDRDNPGIQADAAEAVFGAVFVEAGYSAACLVIGRFVEMVRKLEPTTQQADPKGRLQELLQARGEKPPLYRVTARTGPDHAARFKVELVSSLGLHLASGEGSSIKAAEVDAARSALLRCGEKKQ